MRTLFMSIPIALPLGPTLFAAKKRSNPAPLPKSMTISPWTINGKNQYLVTFEVAEFISPTYLLHVCRCERVTTTSSKICSFGDRFELFQAVAKCLRNFLTMLSITLCLGTFRKFSIVLLNWLINLIRIHNDTRLLRFKCLVMQWYCCLVDCDSDLEITRSSRRSIYILKSHLMRNYWYVTHVFKVSLVKCK